MSLEEKVKVYKCTDKTVIWLNTITDSKQEINQFVLHVSKWVNMVGFETKFKQFNTSLEAWLTNKFKSGILLYGPSGTGKTTFMKRIS